MRTISDLFGLNKTYKVTGVFNLVLEPEAAMLHAQRFADPDLVSALSSLFAQACNQAGWQNNGGGETRRARFVKENGEVGFQLTVEPNEELRIGQLRAFERRLIDVKPKFFALIPWFINSATKRRTLKFVATKEL